MNTLTTSSSHCRRKLMGGGLIAIMALAGGALALVSGQPRPVGAVLSYVSTIEGITIRITSARDDAGRPFAFADAHYSARPELGGATMGAAPGGYSLPVWVEFEWRELTDMIREADESYEAWRARVDKDTRKLVTKKERVYVASKIPLAAIEEVRKAQSDTLRGELPKKMLWVYFVWTRTGIKVRWEVYRAYPGRRTPWQGDPLE